MKTTFFGLNRFQNSLSMQMQVRTLVEHTGFPAVMGFEFYPVLVCDSNFLTDPTNSRQTTQLQERGYEVIEQPSFLRPQIFTPGQLVMIPVVPVQKLKISQEALRECLQNSVMLWLQKYRIQSFKTESGVGTDKGLIAIVDSIVDDGIAQALVKIHVSNQLSTGEDSVQGVGTQLDLKSAFDEWNLYFASELMKIVSR
jgi:hypothetical protein